MTEIVHFTDLKHKAVRGQLERGMRYLECHDSRHDPYNYSGAAFASEVLILSRVRTMSTSTWRVPGELVSPAHRFIPMYATQYKYESPGHKLHWRSAGDSGLWDFESSYHNKTNFMLDIAALRREGIHVDIAPIARRLNAPKWDDNWDDHNLYEDDTVYN